MFSRNMCCCLAILKEEKPSSCGSGETLRWYSLFLKREQLQTCIAAGLLKKRGARVYGESQQRKFWNCCLEKQNEGREKPV